jgi:hypothetical protein
MQTTRPEGMSEELAEIQGKLRKELFTADSKKELENAMDERLEYLTKHRREVLVSRTQIEPEAIPLVIADFSAKIIMAHDRGHRKRLKKEVIKLIEKL